MPAALFIVGTSRSGTSWVFDLCASHPDMSMGYESKLPVEGIEVHRRFADRLRRPPERQAAMSELFKALHDTIDDPSNTELFERLRDPEVMRRAVSAYELSPGWPTVCETIYCSLEGTSHWGNKLLRIELTEVLLEQWPDAKFLVLTRDPRGVMASQAKKFDHSVDYSATYWNTHAEYVTERLGLRPGEHDDRFLVVDLVEMARDPRPSLEWAFAAVGLSLAPIDDLVERFPGDPDRLDKWRSTLDPALQLRVEGYCFEQMRALGYEPTLATAPRRVSRLRRLLAMTREHGGELLRDPGAIRRKQVGRRVRAALKLGR